MLSEYKSGNRKLVTEFAATLAKHNARKILPPHSILGKFSQELSSNPPLQMRFLDMYADYAIIFASGLGNAADIENKLRMLLANNQRESIRLIVNPPMIREKNILDAKEWKDHIANSKDLKDFVNLVKSWQPLFGTLKELCRLLKTHLMMPFCSLSFNE